MKKINNILVLEQRLIVSNKEERQVSLAEPWAWESRAGGAATRR